MDTKVVVPLALGAGYLLGRTHKFRWAVILGTAAATGSLGGLPAQAIQRGTQVMQSTPELAKMADSAQKLLEAGRGAAMSAMSSRVESMGQALEGRAQDLGGGAVTGGQQVVEKARPSRRGTAGQRSTEERDKYDEEANDEQDRDDQEQYDDDLDESEDQYEDEDQDEDQDEDKDEDEQPVSRERRPSGAPGRGSAVRRARG